MASENGLNVGNERINEGATYPEDLKEHVKRAGPMLKAKRKSHRGRQNDQATGACASRDHGYSGVVPVEQRWLCNLACEALHCTLLLPTSLHRCMSGAHVQAPINTNSNLHSHQLEAWQSNC